MKVIDAESPIVIFFGDNRYRSFTSLSPELLAFP